MKLNALKVHNRRQNELFIEKLEKEREEYEKMTDEEKSEYNRKKTERRERLKNVMAGINMISEIAEYGSRAFLKGEKK